MLHDVPSYTHKIQSVSILRKAMIVRVDPNRGYVVPALASRSVTLDMIMPSLVESMLTEFSIMAILGKHLMITAIDWK